MTREEARREIDSLDFYLQNHTNDYGEESHTAMMMAIEALSSSEKPNKWIPVSERLPDKATRVLTSWVYVPTGTKYIEVAERYGDDDYYDFFGDTDSCKMNQKDHKVIAWMPLPEPYKPQESEVQE